MLPGFAPRDPIQRLDDLAPALSFRQGQQSLCQLRVCGERAIRMPAAGLAGSEWVNSCGHGSSLAGWALAIGAATVAVTVAALVLLLMPVPIGLSLRL
jgi:hypothetical protein